MPQYAILRFEKHKGTPARAMEAHHERQKEKYASNPDVDTSRSQHNFHLIQPQGRYYQFIQKRIEQAGCRTRKDSTRFVDTLITASPEFFQGKNVKEVTTAYFQRAADFLIERVGRENIISAVVHMDEKTPHMHLAFVPLTKDNRLSAKEILGGRADLSKWQDDFHAHMVQAFPDLERGESTRDTGRQHIPTRVFKQAVHLTKQAQRIKAALAGINPLNAAKNREEVLALLERFFPQMEDFETVLKKYKAGFSLLKKENAALSMKAAEGSERKIQSQLERNKLEAEVRELRRFMDAIPDDYKRQIQAMQRQHKERV